MLPIAELKNTMQHFLASLRPVLKPRSCKTGMQLINCKLSDEQLEKMANLYDETEALVSSFLIDEGPQLQCDLRDHASKCVNWVSK